MRSHVNFIGCESDELVEADVNMSAILVAWPFLRLRIVPPLAQLNQRKVMDLYLHLLLLLGTGQVHRCLRGWEERWNFSGKSEGIALVSRFEDDSSEYG